MRDFNLIIPFDCVASLDEKENEHALKHMERVFKADIRKSNELDLYEIKKRIPRERNPCGTRTNAQICR